VVVGRSGGVPNYPPGPPTSVGATKSFGNRSPIASPDRWVIPKPRPTDVTDLVH
jgi:hypothetical protein